VLILRALRGTKAPLFHGTSGIQEFFRILYTRVFQIGEARGRVNSQKWHDFSVVPNFSLDRSSFTFN